MNLTRIYENIKKEYESKGIEIDEEKLRQLAWMKRDRMMFESNVAAAAAAAAGRSWCWRWRWWWKISHCCSSSFGIQYTNRIWFSTY